MEVTPDLKEEFLSIFCVDTLQIKARVTFDECTHRGVHITFWSEETEESTKILDDVFDILFDEVMKMRRMEQGRGETNTIRSIMNE